MSSRHCRQIVRTKCMNFSILASETDLTGELSTSDDISIISRACLCWSGFGRGSCSCCMFERLSWFDLMARVSCTLESTLGLVWVCEASSFDAMRCHAMMMKAFHIYLLCTQFCRHRCACPCHVVSFSPMPHLPCANWRRICGVEILMPRVGHVTLIYEHREHFPIYYSHSAVIRDKGCGSASLTTEH